MYYSYYPVSYSSSSYLAHSGVKGMKWGVRRYMNRDGSLTKKGMRKYGKYQRDLEYYNQAKKHKIGFIGDEFRRGKGLGKTKGGIKGGLVGTAAAAVIGASAAMGITAMAPAAIAAGAALVGSIAVGRTVGGIKGGLHAANYSPDAYMGARGAAKKANKVMKKLNKKNQKMIKKEDRRDAKQQKRLERKGQATPSPAPA